MKSYHFSLKSIIISAMNNNSLMEKCDFTNQFDDKNFSTLNSGYMWKKISEQVGECKMFPIILYMDASKICNFANVQTHPIYIYMGALPIEHRFEENYRYLYGFIPKDIDLFLVMNIFGKR
jgi:hypothetical protein